MSFQISNAQCDPNRFPPPRDVAVTFRAQSLGGTIIIDVVYEASDFPNLQLNGQSRVGPINETITESATTIAQTITVSGNPGIWPVVITVTDPATGFSNQLACSVELL